MSGAPDATNARVRARAAEEEVRYRAVTELDPADAEDRALLLSLLADPSWRVRSVAVERVAGARPPEPVLEALLSALSGGPNIGSRDAAATALARIGPPAVAPLLARLSAPDVDVRQAAASVLGVIADRRAAVPLATRLADPDPNVRAAAAEALGKIGGPEAAAPLLAALDSDDPTLRFAALEALSAMRACPPAERLEPLLADRALRRPVYRALGWSDDPAAAPLLAGGLAETSRGVREAALAGIGAQRTRRGGAELEGLAAAVRVAVAPDGEAAEACAAALSAEDPAVAVGGLAALGWSGALGHLSAMLALAEDDRLRPFVEEAAEALPRGAALRAAVAAALETQGPFGRLTALSLLARQGSPAALESLIREASDPSGYLQAEAISALGRLSSADAVAPLVGLLGDDAPAVSGIAATALVRLGQEAPTAANAALSLLRDRAGSSPSAALFRVLGALGTPDDLPRLRTGLGRASVVQRMAAAGAISSLAQRGVLRGVDVPELLTALCDGAWSVRAAAARALLELARQGALGSAPGSGSAARRGPAGATLASPAGGFAAAAQAALVKSLHDSEPAVRAASVEALGASGQATHAAAIAALVRAPDVPPVVVVAALQALSALASMPADVLARAADHSDPEVVKEAVAAAARLPGPDGEALLRRAAQSPRWDVRQAVARALAARGDPALRQLAAELAEREPDLLVARAFGEAAQALAGR
jgi:HEAT repeat protein